MTLVPNLTTIAAGNSDDPTRDMSNWNAIRAVVNGNLDDSNIAASAGIDISKTDLGTYTAPTAYTPTVVGGTSAGTPTYTLQKGEYGQIGKMVFFSARVSYSAHDGTGDLRFSLPVTAGTYDGFTYELVCRITEANLLDQAMWITASVATGGTFMTLQITRDSTAASQVQIINETTLINITGFYKVA